MDAAYRIIKLPMMVMVFTLMSAAISEAAEQTFPENPKFEVDASWPKLPLPNNWTLGEVGGITVDARDHVWIVQRPGTLFTYEKGASFEPPISNCCIPAPPVMEFDQEGNVVSAWGGPGEGYEWPDSEHGISIDYKGNVWIAGNGRGSRDDDSVPPDGVVLKFSPDGEFLLQIGQRAPSKGSSDPNQLAGPADMAVDPETNEVFVADGYRNHRVIVFDGDTGELSECGEPTAGDQRIKLCLSTIRPRRRRNSSVTYIVWRSLRTASYTCAIGTTTAYRSFNETAPLSKSIFISRIP